MSSPSADPGPGDTGGHRGRHESITLTAASSLAAFFCIGLIAGWGFHYAKRLGSGLDPSVSWPTPGALFFLAGFLVIATLRTRAARRAGVRLPSYRAVNLLALGKACARVGAAVFGGYAGFALAYLGESMSVPGVQLMLVGLTCLAGIALAMSGLALERACEITTPTDEER